MARGVGRPAMGVPLAGEWEPKRNGLNSINRLGLAESLLIICFPISVAYKNKLEMFIKQVRKVVISVICEGTNLCRPTRRPTMSRLGLLG
jgi:hypothetical protein